jgi:metallophosphoesterase (TIGR03767 family)
MAATLSCSLVISPAALAADDSPEGKTTVEQTIKESGGDGFRTLKKGKGEDYKVRTELAKAKKKRADKRTSLAFFGQITDPQLADEMSPGRLELIDPVGGATSAAWRPQEALGAFVFDSIIRNLNANKKSRVKQGDGKKAKLQFSLLTGDIADSQQVNEVGWFKGLLNGDTVEPFSGKPISASNPCTPFGRAAPTPDQIAALNLAVAQRRYTGVQDFTDWPGQGQRYNGFWDPNLGGLPNTTAIADYDDLPAFPGLMDRAQQKFKAQGLKTPWYITRGNHDTLVQGNVPANAEIGGILKVDEVTTGCQKPWPNNKFDPGQVDTSDSSKVFDQVAKQVSGIFDSLTALPLVPPDPDRRHISKKQFKENVGSGDKEHGFGYVSNSENSASDGNASYYGFNKGKFRILMLDTNAEGGGAQGNLDDPQYQWLAGQLDKYSSVEVKKGKLKRDKDKNKLIILSSHHTLETMDNTTPDEAANVGFADACTPEVAGCDSDPRTSTPLHLGTTGDKSLLSLIKRYPNVIAYVNGHTHHNRVKAFKGDKGGTFRGGFWQINTASHVDWAQQSRTVEFMDNKDETLSIFGTILNSAAPIKAPAAGTPAANMTEDELASISRTLAANDPQVYDTTDSSPDTGGPLGKKKDRNVELLVKDPRQLWKSGK